MSLKVIGAGLGRTGTLSLKFALEHIGFGPCYHMTEALARAPVTIPLWTAAAKGKPDWDAIFEGFTATVDYPACTYWRELAAYYPQAKVILSIRDAESWFESANRTIFVPERMAETRKSGQADFLEILTGWFDGRIGDRDHMIQRFRDWNQSVIEGMPAERLLIYRPGDGWEPICDFLGVPVPQDPYPRVNDALAFENAGFGQTGGSMDKMQHASKAYLESAKTHAI